MTNLYPTYSECEPGDVLEDKNGALYVLDGSYGDWETFKIDSGLPFLQHKSLKAHTRWSWFIPKEDYMEMEFKYHKKSLNKKKLDKEIEEILK